MIRWVFSSFGRNYSSLSVAARCHNPVFRFLPHQFHRSLSQQTQSNVKMGSIQLSDQEETLCQLLHQTCEYIHSERPQIPEIDSTQFSGDGSNKCEARIAGGWVRDKLLFRESDDLDISLSTLTGNAFALYLKHYISSSSFAASPLSHSPFFQDEQSDMGRISKIAANPEQSKNLETATARVLGLSLDFVNLRKETYDPSSRIPEMTFGTPKEDAERRDITINAMLYNVHSRKVEDYTGLGLKDLAAGLIRTPLPPLTTFLEDPLRVLRCVRFASRFAYELHPSIIHCLTGKSIPPNDHQTNQLQLNELASSDEPSVQDGNASVETARQELRNALLSKVSRERFGIEVDKMLKGPNPLLAVYLLHRLELFPLIFHPPPSSGTIYKEEVGSVAPHRTGVFGSDALSLNGARLLDAILKQQAAEDHSANTQIVSIDQLNLSSNRSDDANESESAKAATKIFSRLPNSPIPRIVFEALPQDLLQSWSNTSLKSEDKRRLWINTCLLPLRGLVYEEKKSKYAWAGESVIVNGLKLGSKTLKEPVASLNKAIDILVSPTRLIQEPLQTDSAISKWIPFVPEEATVKSSLGLLLRNPHITNSQLQLSLSPALLMSFISELLTVWQTSSPDGFDPNTSSLSSVVDQATLIAQNYTTFWKTLQNTNLLSRAEEKPLLDGHSITNTIECHPRLISRIQTNVLGYQYNRFQTLPTIESDLKEAEQDCKNWLLDQWKKGSLIPFNERQSFNSSSSSTSTSQKGIDKSKNKKKIHDSERRKRQKSE